MWGVDWAFFDNAYQNNFWALFLKDNRDYWHPLRLLAIIIEVEQPQLSLTKMTKARHLLLLIVKIWSHNE